MGSSPDEHELGASRRLEREVETPLRLEELLPSPSDTFPALLPERNPGDTPDVQPAGPARLPLRLGLDTPLKPGH
jgi:hypothetical protein